MLSGWGGGFCYKEANITVVQIFCQGGVGVSLRKKSRSVQICFPDGVGRVRVGWEKVFLFYSVVRTFVLCSEGAKYENHFNFEK